MKSCPVCKTVYPADFTVCPKDGAALVRVTEFAEGALVRGKYEILGKLGAGGMGTVYKARHLHFNEIYALKVVKSHLLEESEFLQRFRSEALVMRRLSHPNAVQVRDLDETEDGRPFMVLEFVEGQSLDQVMATDGQLDPHRAVGVASQVCSALSAAHELGIIHRDIKPSNILLTPLEEGGEHVKVLDFGVAKVKESSHTLYRPSLTGTGFVVGTPEYMSPEQAMGTRGDLLDGRTDLYSLGIVLFEMLTGRLPFSANTPVMLLVAHVQTQPISPLSLRGDLHPGLARLVLRALEKNPDHRFESAAAMKEELEGLARQLVPVRSPTTASGTRSVSRVAAAAAAPPQVTPSPRPAPAPPPPRPVPQREIFRQPEPEPPAPWKYAVFGGVGALVAVVAFLVVTGRLGTLTSSPSTPAPATAPATTTEPPAPPAVQPAAEPTTTPTEPVESENERTVRALLREARAAYERGDRASARRLLEEAQRLAPEHADVRSARRQMRRAFEAERPAAPATPPQPKIDTARLQELLQQGKQAMDRGSYDGAIAAFEAALLLDPTNPEALRGLERARRAKAAEEELLHKLKQP